MRKMMEATLSTSARMIPASTPQPKMAQKQAEALTILELAVATMVKQTPPDLTPTRATKMILHLVRKAGQKSLATRKMALMSSISTKRMRGQTKRKKTTGCPKPPKSPSKPRCRRRRTLLRLCCLLQPHQCCLLQAHQWLACLLQPHQCCLLQVHQ